MNEMIDIAYFGFLSVASALLTIAILIVGIDLVFKAIDLAKWNLYDLHRKPTKEEMDEAYADLERINRK